MGEMGAVQGRVGEAGAVGGGLEACAERGCEPLWAKGGAARTGGYMGEATTLGTRGARAAFYGTGWAPSEAERSCASRGSMFQTQQLSAPSQWLVEDGDVRWPKIGLGTFLKNPSTTVHA